MKKGIFTSICLLTFGAAFGQFRVGPEAGILFSNYPGKLNGDNVNAKSVFGGRVGATADLTISGGFGIQGSLLYVANGYQLSNVIATQKMTLNTLEVPVSIIWRSGEQGDDRFFAGVGPYIGWNLSGKIKETGSGISETRQVNIGDTRYQDDTRKTDYGLGGYVGYELSMGLFIRAHFQKGLANLQPGGDADNVAKSMNYGVSFGYLFGGKRSAE